MYFYFNKYSDIGNLFIKMYKPKINYKISEALNFISWKLRVQVVVEKEKKFIYMIVERKKNNRSEKLV